MDSCSVEGEIKAVRETQSYNPAGISSDVHMPANLASFFFLLCSKLIPYRGLIAPITSILPVQHATYTFPCVSAPNLILEC